ncbi:MAG TPA: sugar kinase [Chthonomonadaceae bacterium]|nr:sugar kinase [Chthonomonadaceae bacterium]
MSAPEVVSLGNMLVEVMRLERDEPLDRPGRFAGPFPSGDTPIYVDTIARLGRSAGFLGAVGKDAFGQCLLDRFARDGVDSARVKVLSDYSTGVAFVAYFSDGSRTFLFHWRHAAAGQLGPEDVPADYLQGARWLHLTGCNLAICESARQACLRAMELLPEGARVSFDPNLRPEVLSVEEIRALCQPVLGRADVFFPSAGEARMFTGAQSDEEGCRKLAAEGKLVALKQGPAGCRLFTAEEERTVPGFAVPEVDPTGAGDAFCAGFTVALLEGMPLSEAGRFANAVGALAVTKRGPMEGVPSRAEVHALMEAAARGG